MKVKIHDNQVQKYIVDFEKKEIMFNTITENKESVDIVFAGVVAYFFENTINGCIIFDIEESSFNDFISDLGESYILEHKKYCWPLDFIDINDLKEKILERKINIYSLSSSYGMNGNVLAESIEIIKHEEIK